MPFPTSPSPTFRGYRRAAIRLFLLAASLAVFHQLAIPGRLHSLFGSRSSHRAGFELGDATIPIDQIFGGGPPKDGIPAITDPKIIAASDADYLSDPERVIGVAIGGEARAYPLRFLMQHEVVNDQLAGQAIAVTYCPLCDSAVVIDRRDGDQLREFGVSGLLYNSNVLLFDRGAQVESLWSQMMTEAIAGPMVKQRLRTLPLELTSWSDWRSRFPNTSVMSRETGHAYDYQQNPYEFYFETPAPSAFPVDKVSDRLPPKTRVLGVWTNDAAWAIPQTAFNEQQTERTFALADRRVRVVYNPTAGSLRVDRADPGVEWAYSFWFAWYAFHPDTEVADGLERKR